MKLDTSSYYPKSPLGDDPLDETPASGIEKEKPEVEPENKKRHSIVETGQREDVPKDWEIFVARFCNFLSWILVPLLMPVYGLLLAFGLSILSFADIKVKLIFTLIVAAITLVIPSLLVVLLKKFGLVEDVGLNGRKERTIPYVICILSLVATALFMWFRAAPLWLTMFFAGGAVAGVVEVVVNFRWKISVHAAGIAGIVALLLRIMRSGYASSDAFVWLIVAVVLAGMLGSARVWLQRHTVTQVLAGYAVGFCSIFFMTMIH
ncbi:MAG: phosphatase PAP2 family protein [Candidatus Amulumruptor caecigallinarius]|nr:phosphatase PAP2 family protein [Candidatus Amulumruptor caecigallinarius]